MRLSCQMVYDSTDKGGEKKNPILIGKILSYLPLLELLNHD